MIEQALKGGDKEKDDEPNPEGPVQALFNDKSNEQEAKDELAEKEGN